jgi:hypothetical protein
MRTSLTLLFVLSFAGCEAYNAQLVRLNEQNANDPINKIEADDDARRDARDRALETRCGLVETFPAGVQPSRPFRVIAPLDVKWSFTDHGAYDSMQKQACMLGADAVVGMAGNTVHAGATTATVSNVGGFNSVTVDGGSSHTTYSAAAIVYTDKTSRQPVRIDVQGSDASANKLQRCQQSVSAAGGLWDDTAPVHAVLVLEPGNNSVQIVSNNAGIVLAEHRPSWRIERLCDNAAAAILEQENREARPSVHAGL